MNAEIKRARRGIYLTLYYCIFFTIFTLAAMIVYPGGTYNDHYATAYLFWENFFSDLGRVTTFLGDINIFSMPLFVLATFFVGLAFISFSYNMPKVMKGVESSRFYINFGSFFGYITGISFMGVGFTPWDYLLLAHGIFVYTAFISFLAMVILYAIAIFNNIDYSNYYGFLFLFFAVALFVYVITLFTNPAIDTVDGLKFMAGGQKIIVYLSIVIMAIQAVGAIAYIEQKQIT